MCPTCHRPVPYAKRHRGQRYCSQACFLQRSTVPKLYHRWNVADLVRALNSGRPLELVAADLGVSRAHLYRCMREARICRVGGRGHYAIVHWRNARQLSLF